MLKSLVTLQQGFKTFTLLNLQFHMCHQKQNHTKRMVPLSHQSLLLAHTTHKSNIRMFIIWVTKIFLQILGIFLIFMKMVLMKKPIVVKCFTCGDYDHKCIRNNVPYIFISVESILGNWTSCMCYECLLSHLCNSTLESC